MADLIASINEAVSGAMSGSTSQTTNDRLITDYQGTQYDAKTILNLANQVAKNLDVSKSSGGVFGTQGQSVGFDFAESSRILGRAPTAAEQVTLDMARELARQGVTDINQLQQKTYTTPDQFIASEGGDYVIPGYETQGLFAGDKQIGGVGSNQFGVTYTGKGGTGYNIEFDPNTGKPKFSTSGVSTSDADALAPLLLMGGLALGAPYLGNLFGAGAGTTLGGLGATELAIAAGEGLLPVTAGQLTTAGLTGSQLGALGSGIGLGGAGLAGAGLGGAATGGGAGVNYGLGTGSNLASMGGGQGLTGGVGANLAGMGGGQGLSTTLGAGTSLTGGVGGMGPLMTAGGLVLPGAGTLAGTNALTGLPLGSTVLGTNVVTGTGGLTTLGGLGNAGVTTGPGGSLLSTQTVPTVPGTVPVTPPIVPGTTPNVPGTLGNLLGSLTTGPGLAGLLSGLGSLTSGVLGASAAEKAARIQQETALAQMEQQKKLFDIINAQQAPYRTAGYGALSTIGGMLPGQQPVYDTTGKQIGTQEGTGYLTQQYTPELFQKQIDPGYAFRLAQGQMAAQRAANVAGGGLGGNVMRGLQDYTQGLASTEYGNAFNRFQAQRQNIYNTLAGIAGIGQTGQTAANQAAQQYGQNVANLATGAAGAQAAGTIGAAQGYGQGISGLTNSLMLAQLLGQNQNVAAQPTIG